MTRLRQPPTRLPWFSSVNTIFTTKKDYDRVKIIIYIIVIKERTVSLTTGVGKTVFLYTKEGESACCTIMRFTVLASVFMNKVGFMHTEIIDKYIFQKIISLEP